MSKHKKILIVNDHAANMGIGKYTFQLYEKLCQEESDKFSFHLLMQNMRKNYSPSTPNTTVQHRLLSPKRSGFSKKYDLMAYYYFPQKIPQGFSLYHISSQMMGKSVQYVSPAVVTCHDIIPFKRKSSHSFISQHLRRKSLKAITRAKYIIFNSNYTKKEFLNHFNYNVEKTAVIHLGVSNIFQPRDKFQIRKKLNLPLNRPIVLHVGSEEHRKNVKTIIYSINKIKRQMPDILFIRLGRQRKQSRRLIEKLDLKENVFYVKRNQPEERVAEFYNAADVFAFPSTYEGFGLPVLEALKSGCPVVASSASSIPEITGDAAILHNPLDVEAFATSIETIINNKNISGEYAKKGIEQSKYFSWEITAKKTIQIYKRILEI